MKGLKIVYVLPVKGGGGGAHSVAQEVNELVKFGVDAYIAVNQGNVTSFATNYSDMDDLRNRIVSFSTTSELSLLLEGSDIVVCTIFTSVNTVKSALKEVKRSKPRVAYYIQDYEPLFCNPGDALYNESKGSYTSISNMLLFAKTDWIRDVVTRNHDVEVKKVSPSIDTSLYYPSTTKSDDVIRIAAMVRPSTPRRAPLRTMSILKEISERHGKQVSIDIFGCSHVDIYDHQLPSDFSFTNHGVLSRKQVAALLRQVNMFLDLSDYQAFGRTGLEAMACGCVSMLPVFGGAHEYARHDINSFLVDTRSKSDILASFDSYVAKGLEERQNMSVFAVETSQRYSIGRAAYSKLQVFKELLAA